MLCCNLTLTQREPLSDPQSLTKRPLFLLTAMQSPWPEMPRRLAGTKTMENPGSKLSPIKSSLVSVSSRTSNPENSSCQPQTSALLLVKPPMFQTRTESPS